MKIIECKGYELEKARSNTSEDFFNRSEVVYLDQNEEKTFHLLYVRYFDELLINAIPYDSETLFTVGSREVTIKDIVGLVCLLSNPSFRSRKRVYINTIEELLAYFKDVNYVRLTELFHSLENKQTYEVKDPITLVK
ncbi:hypothetical protein [Bacillus sp. PS06]|uniref:hypothetical protein n=1 Tax=Bacillus sp. PS06 TaxID=2764176 RepID=UPI001783BA78|nr:hypothetical protein [Bacillus sp. PS06]MBD8070311.1 hypothetical protein [Bacillus sp. PS06]